MTLDSYNQDRELVETLSKLQYAPYGLLPDQTIYVLESYSYGWSDDRRDKLQVRLKYATQDSTRQIWLMSHDPQEWLTLEPYQREVYISGCLRSGSEELLYSMLLPHLANREAEYTVLSNTLHQDILSLIHALDIQPRTTYQLTYASYTLCLFYDDERPIPFTAVSIGFPEEAFRDVLNAVIPIELKDPQVRAPLLQQMSVQFEKKQARSDEN